MFVSSNTYGYSNKKKYITGRGFVETITSIIKSVMAPILGASKQLMSSAVPALKNIGAYVKDNRDLIAKPVLSAVGSLGAVGVLTGVPAILMHIASRNQKAISAKEMEAEANKPENGKYREILKNIVGPMKEYDQVNQVSNIIGSGIKTF